MYIIQAAFVVILLVQINTVVFAVAVVVTVAAFTKLKQQVTSVEKLLINLGE